MLNQEQPFKRLTQVLLPHMDRTRITTLQQQVACLLDLLKALPKEQHIRANAGIDQSLLEFEEVENGVVVLLRTEIDTFRNGIAKVQISWLRGGNGFVISAIHFEGEGDLMSVLEPHGLLDGIHVARAQIPSLSTGYGMGSWEPFSLSNDDGPHFAMVHVSESRAVDKVLLCWRS